MVVWSGSLERHGQCASLSGYQGASQLQSVQPQERVRVPKAPRSRLDFRAGSPLMRKMTRLVRLRTYSASQIALKCQVSRWSVERLEVALGLRVARPRKAAA
jgi:hypothetical protein